MASVAKLIPVLLATVRNVMESLHVSTGDLLWVALVVILLRQLLPVFSNGAEEAVRRVPCTENGQTIDGGNMGSFSFIGQVETHLVIISAELLNCFTRESGRYILHRRNFSVVLSYSLHTNLYWRMFRIITEIFYAERPEFGRTTSFSLRSNIKTHILVLQVWNWVGEGGTEDGRGFDGIYNDWWASENFYKRKASWAGVWLKYKWRSTKYLKGSYKTRNSTLIIKNW